MISILSLFYLFIMEFISSILFKIVIYYSNYLALTILLFFLFRISFISIKFKLEATKGIDHSKIFM